MFCLKLFMRHVMHEWGMLSWWSCQSPVAHSCGLLSHLNIFHGGMFKLNRKFDADSLLYLLSHFECEGRTVHMLTQWHELSQLTSTVMSSLFTCAHSSPFSLAARLHLCCTNHSCYINNGWTFYGQMTLYRYNAYHSPSRAQEKKTLHHAANGKIINMRCFFPLAMRPKTWNMRLAESSTSH